MKAWRPKGGQRRPAFGPKNRRLGLKGLNTIAGKGRRRHRWGRPHVRGDLNRVQKSGLGFGIAEDTHQV